jgi:hypothetical protein
MSLPIAGQVGPSAINAADGSCIEFRQGHTGELIAQELHGRYFETMARGALFSAANQAAQAVSVALATTYTGLCLYNPLGSGRILVPTKVKFALSVAPAAIATIGLICGFAATGGVTAQTSKLTVQSAQIGNTGVGVGIALSQATIVTPTWLQQIQDGFTAAALPAPTLPLDLEGTFGILPGGFIAIGALTAVTGLGSIVWEELPYNPQG